MNPLFIYMAEDEANGRERYLSMGSKAMFLNASSIVPLFLALQVVCRYVGSITFIE